MRCPFCNCLDTQVKDSRMADDGSYIRRRRFCPECGSRFTTFERVQLREVMVIKSDNVEVPFDREKLLKSVQLATRKRGIDNERIDKIVSSIQRQIETSGESSVSSKYIGDLVLNALLNLDIVSYIRFASVYKNFKSVEDFNKIINNIHCSDDSCVVFEDDKKEQNKNKSFAPNNKLKDSLF